MSKIARKTLDFGRGIKVTIERPYSPQDAVEEFKAAIEKAGGKVTQVQDELTVTGAVSTADVMKATQKLTEDLGVATSGHVGMFVGGDYSDLEARALAHALGGDAGPFGFPSFAHISPTGRFTAKAEDVLRQSRPAPKLKPAVAKVAPKALSTWEFRSEYLQRMYGHKVHLVGQHYRNKADQEVLGWKREGNMALLVAEPDNPVDLNAVMVLAWNDQAKNWHHVGYVRATEAALLRGKWTGDHKNAMVARFTLIPSNADGHRGGRNIELTLTGEVRTYPGYQL